ncbi:hypothetical protein L228DRAFT_248880 [Xylona heveae TC161]|uniref:Autophagy-related protein 29 n=1 Tax=Xylona heveae (strain CBS 132557 / TC161) TaxID=1328760 RepID=A0A165FLF4_XYLHT|nr:hypothetical protein L228DRAFT_248880 [Xylona heveae TC161]KZF21115.1 hypothetical protein L228DRAFT_248880 [Xylona heveae TC161]
MAAIPDHILTQPGERRPSPPNVHFTVFIRLPFPRGDFVDPPPVDWDASKDRSLWKVLSQASRSADINWHDLADQFEVTLPFLLQQAAWLYERQLSQVRAQMRKVGNPLLAGGSATSTPTSLGGPQSNSTMKRGPSGSTAPRIPSSLSMRSRDSPVPRPDTIGLNAQAKISGTSLSRTSSSNTATQSRQYLPLHLGQTTSRSIRSSFPQPLKSQPAAKALPKATDAGRAADSTGVESPKLPSNDDDSPEEDSSSSSSDSDSGVQNYRSQIFRRPPRFAAGKASAGRYDEGDDEDEEEDDGSPAFLPFSNPSTVPTHDSNATLRTGAQQQQAPPRRTFPGNISRQRLTTEHSSASSTSSNAAAAAQNEAAPIQQRGPGPLSPRRPGELAALSPRRRATVREGSDGTPSMGSSFSDLDDASVTQSALEEALLSNMQHGGVASRMSSISQALRSRYL